MKVLFRKRINADREFLVVEEGTRFVVGFAENETTGHPTWSKAAVVDIDFVEQEPLPTAAVPIELL